MIPYIRAANVKDGRLEVADVLRMNFTEDEQLRFGLRHGDVLVTEGCGSPLELGASAQWRDDLPGVVGFQNHVLRLRSVENISDSDFLLAVARWCHHGLRWLEASSGTSILNISLGRAQKVLVPAPPFATQRAIGAVLRSFDEAIEINERRIEVLEDVARSLYREWFVRFRFPGHENVDLVDSELGPIPRGWRVEPMAKVAGGNRHAITSGPFGSKLGRKDYVEGGVPVIRGTNLKLGGGFVDRGFVFVTESKADELASSIAKPKDIVITQRGTLGQVGLVPESPSFDRYVISQSQMKVTIDPQTASAQYVYSVLRSADTTQRILNMAITAGVPHINLALLREMLIVVPPIEAQLRFEGVVGELNRRIELGRQTTVTLSTSRDLLLPLLVTGQLDISEIDLGVLTPKEAA